MILKCLDCGHKSTVRAIEDEGGYCPYCKGTHFSYENINKEEVQGKE